MFIFLNPLRGNRMDLKVILYLQYSFVVKKLVNLKQFFEMTLLSRCYKNANVLQIFTIHMGAEM